MGTAGTQRLPADWTWRFVILVLCGFLVLISGQALFRKWQNRESVRVNKSVDWIQQTAQRLKQVQPPTTEPGPGAPDAPWVVPGYFIFKNGWAAYDHHSVHAMDGLGDLAVLRLSDGRLYFSKLHYCCGMTDMMQPSGPEQLPQAEDAEDFLAGTGRYQQWTLLSSGERLLGMVICPEADRPHGRKKSLWVVIIDPKGGNQRPRFERRYTFSGNFLAWTTQWNSDDDLAVVVFDNNRSPMMVSGDESVLPTNYLATLRFHRDRQTGRFTATEL